MPNILVKRALQKRGMTEDAGKRIQDWIASRSPDVVFALTVVACFISSIIIIAAVWEVIRRCRSSLHAGRQDRWHRLADGSSVRERDFAYAGPVETLTREGQPGYVPARAAPPTRDMRLEAYAMSGRYGAYDPPMAAGRGFPGPLTQSPGQGLAPAPGAGMRPASRATVDSEWSEQTKIGDEQATKKVGDDKPADFAAMEQSPAQTPLSLPYQPPPPAPAPAVPLVSSAPSFRAPGHVSTPSISQSIETSRDLPLPGTPPTSPLLNRSSSTPSAGEAAFSTPKPTSTPVGGAANPARPTHQRGASSGGFTPVPLALSSAASARSLSLSSSVVSGPEPPKVELKRTWSIGTWIPQLKEGGAGKREEDEEEKTGLVSRA